MSKLTDKIEALFVCHEIRLGRGPDRLNNILADVQELEERVAFLDRTYKWTQAAHDFAVQQAKREAYEHALELLEHSRNYGNSVMLAEDIRTAIEALDAEGI